MYKSKPSRISLAQNSEVQETDKSKSRNDIVTAFERISLTPQKAFLNDSLIPNYRNYLETYENVQKIAESSFSEAFNIIRSDMSEIVIKITPINRPKKLKELSPYPISFVQAQIEAAILDTIGGLKEHRKFSVPMAYTGFVNYYRSYFARGKIPKQFIDACKKWSKKNVSENIDMCMTAIF